MNDSVHAVGSDALLPSDTLATADTWLRNYLMSSRYTPARGSSDLLDLCGDEDGTTSRVLEALGFSTSSWAVGLRIDGYEGSLPFSTRDLFAVVGVLFLPGSSIVWGAGDLDEGEYDTTWNWSFGGGLFAECDGEKGASILLGPELTRDDIGGCSLESRFIQVRGPFITGVGSY
jgi:hypothetical protein